MISLNNKKVEWQEGMTVEKLLQINNYSYPRIIVTINNNVIPAEEYSSAHINDGDNVKIIHLMAGG